MSEEQGLLAGYAKIDVTPDYQVGLGGYSNMETRRSLGVAARIYATCIALTDGKETILMFTVDNCNATQWFIDETREQVTAATGIPGDKIFYAATHTHNAPSIYGYPEARKYGLQLMAACATAARAALADRAPAKVMASKKKFPGMNFVRHVELEDGRDVGYGYQNYKSPVVGFAGPADNEMVLIKFAREEKQDIILVNWQGHPDCARQIGFELIAPSFVGPLRDTIEAGTGAAVAYFTGADGNMVIESMLPEYRHGLKWRRYGVKMGTLALEAIDEMVEVEGSGIATARAIMEVDVDHSWDPMVEQAKEVYDVWKSQGKEAGDALGKNYNFSSVYQARAIIARSEMPKTRELEINAIRVGGVGFTTGTYEMFAQSGIDVKEKSPYEFTFLLTSNHGYIPCDRAYNNRGYEADTGFYARGVAEALVDKYLEMLNDIQ